MNLDPQWQKIIVSIRQARESSVKFPETQTSKVQALVIEELVGAEKLEELVKFVISQADGADEIEAFLLSIRSATPTRIAWNIFKTSTDTETKSASLMFIKHMAHGSAQEYLAELAGSIEYENAAVQILDALSFNESLTEGETEKYLQLFDNSTSEYVTKMITFIQCCLSNKKARNQASNELENTLPQCSFEG